MKSEIITVKVSKGEKESIKEAADEMKMKLSEFVREAVLRDCKLCKPNEEDNNPVTKDKVTVNLSLDRQVLKKLDKYCDMLGTSRSLMVKRLICEKKPVSLNISLDLNSHFDVLSEFLHEFMRGNRMVIRLLNGKEGALGDEDRDYVIKNSERANKCVEKLFKYIWKMNILVNKKADEAIADFLKENG